MRSLLDVRYNMVATVLNQYAPAPVDTDPNTNDADTSLDGAVTGGHWETIQDPDTNAISRVWVDDVAVAPIEFGPGRSRRPGTDWNDANIINRFDIECEARGFPQVGFRSSADTENFLNGQYLPLEFVQIKFPAKYVLNRRQFVTNIRNQNKHILWLEEETGQPTVFEVQGTIPTFDPFGRHIDNMAVLRRSSIQ